MGIGLDLTGVARARQETNPDEFCRELCEWLPTVTGEFFEGAHGPGCGHDHDHDDGECGHSHDAGAADDDTCRMVLGTVQLFPSTEALFIETGPGGLLRVSTKTSILGPGYHRWLCGILGKLGEEFDVEWKQFDEEGNPGDETGYFFYKDSARVDHEMLVWLKSACQALLEYQQRGYEGLGLSMPVSPQFLDFGPVLTVLGPRSTEWLTQVINDSARGKDIFPWWDDEPLALVFRNRALCRMWDSVCWRPPLDEQEAELLSSVHNDLCQAYELDPSVALPWFEWNEIVGFLEEEHELELENNLRETLNEFAISHEKEPRIGYRRGKLRTRASGGWSVVVPGSFQELIDDEGNWGSQDDVRQVWISSISIVDKFDCPIPAEELLASDELIEDEDDPSEFGPEIPFGPHEQIIGTAHIRREEDAETPHWQLSGKCAVAGEIAITTILYQDKADEEWAIATWRSLLVQPVDSDDDPNE
jgi:hypothetical protein